MDKIIAALYARVSSDGQARGNTVASQLAALQARAKADAAAIGPDHAYVDEGRSGATLARPALERLRDAVAAGEVDRITCTRPTGWRGAMPIRCCWSRSSAARASKLCSLTAPSAAQPRTTYSYKCRA